MASRFKLPPHITIETVRHKFQRYDTAGDYREMSKHCWYLSVSRMSDWRYTALVMIHELIEMILTKHRGVSWAAIDKFDMEHPELDDPGRDPRAPYHEEHMAADRIERLVALLLGVNWKEYSKAFDKLKWKKGGNAIDS